MDKEPTKTTNKKVEKSLKIIRSFLEDVDDKESGNASSINNNFETGTSSQRPPSKKKAPLPPEKPRQVPLAPQCQQSPLPSFSSAIKNNTGKTGAIPKAQNASKDNKKVAVTSKAGKREQMKKVFNDAMNQKNPIHRITSLTLEGIKVMVIMRGCPGSGKSFLVHNLATNLSMEQSKLLGPIQSWPIDHHVFSSDNFWVNPSNGRYVFNSEYLEYAHLWNQKLVKQAASEGRSPLFIDNTNTRMWEMKAYAALAVEFGYLIEIIESPNKWAFNENELVRRNTHGVHKDAIRRMIDRYEHHITPLKLLNESHLTYPQNVTPPQRCLVSFSTPASKNQQKIFNSRFYCVPLDTILALKPNVNSSTDSLLQFTKSPNINTTNSALSNNIPTKLKNEEIRNPFHNLHNPNGGFTNNANAPFEENTHFLGDPNRSFIHPSNTVQGRQGFIQPQMLSNSMSTVQPQKAPQDVNVRSENYFWEKPSQSAKPKIDFPNQTHNSSVDLLLSLDEETLKALLDQVAVSPQPSAVPNNSIEVKNQISGFDQSMLTSKEGNGQLENLNSNPSGASVDLLSFDDIEIPSTSNAKVDSISPKPMDEPVKLSQKLVPDYCSSRSSSDEVFSDDSDDLSFLHSSCEEIRFPSDEFTCDETNEYVIVQPTGLLVYQMAHEGHYQPSSRKEFIATSKLLNYTKPKRDRALNVGRKAVSNLNNILQSSFKTKTKVVNPRNDDLSSNALLTNDSIQSLKIKQNYELLSKSCVGGNVPLPTSDYNNLPPDLLSSCSSSSPVPLSTSVSNLSSHAVANQSKSETQTILLASNNFESGISDPAETWNEEPVTESTPTMFERSNSPKGQRSVVGRPTAKTSYDFWCNTNYVDFDTLSRVNSGTYSGNDVTLLGRSDAFVSSPSLLNSNSIRAVATHDKSSMTSSEIPTVGKDSGLEILTKMFPDASSEGLAELFEKCQKNLDWAVNLMIDSGSQISEHFVADEVTTQYCDSDHQEPEREEDNNLELASHSALKKSKKIKQNLTSEYSDLVKEFEASFVLNEGCYSDRLKKVRETKFGKPLGSVPSEEYDTRDSSPSNDQESSISDSFDEDEGDMSLVMSHDLLMQLQSKFGPVPNLNGDDLIVKLPVSLARQIYSYALDAICQKMEDQQNIIDLLVKEDEEFARKLQGQENESNEDVSFQEIMDYEVALRTQKKQSQSGTNNDTTFASKLSHQLLIERFPGIDSSTLKTVLEDTNQSLHQATNLLASAGHVPVDPSVLGAHSHQQEEDMEEYQMSRKECISQANAYHEVALKLNDLRKHYFNKAQESYSSGNYAVAAFYRDLVHWYTTQIKESNSKAAKTMLCGNEDASTVDLHFLGVSDAVHVLDLFLDEGIRSLSSRKREVFIITGRGLHSAEGKSKIKPAVKQRLKQRGLKYIEINPGMLKTAITKSSTVSYKVDKFQ